MSTEERVREKLRLGRLQLTLAAEHARRTLRRAEEAAARDQGAETAQELDDLKLASDLAGIALELWDAEHGGGDSQPAGASA